MTVEIRRRHWVVFGLLFALQVLGFVLTLARADAALVVPKSAVSVALIALYVISLCAVSPVLVVTLWERIHHGS